MASLGVMLGDLSISEIEREYGITFSDDERATLKDLKHDRAEFDDGKGGWHFYDVPRTLVVTNDDEGRKAFKVFEKHSGEMTDAIKCAFISI